MGTVTRGLASRGLGLSETMQLCKKGKKEYHIGELMSSSFAGASHRFLISADSSYSRRL